MSIDAGSGSGSGSLDPLRLLQEDLKDDDYELVIASVNRLHTIATALGPTRTRNELIPFLLEFSETDNDEAQTAVARQLGDFTELVGGPQHAHVLIPLLEKLCGEEEFVVRDAAVDALMRLAPKLARTDIPAKFIPLLKRLANGDWFTTRVSACGLFSTVYPLCDQTLQTELRSLFNNLCNDDTPMVRKAAYTSLGKFATTIQKQFFKTDIVPILKALSIDDMDSMRIYTIDACAQLAKYIDAQEYITLVLPLIEGLQDDMSWRVRQQLANLFPDLCYQAQADTVGKRLAPIYVKLIKDKEAEVRTAAATMLSEVAVALKSIALEYFGPVLDGLATDGAQNVRVAFSKSIINLCPAFGKETSGKLLVPLVQQLTKDEHYEVRNNILSRLDVLSEAIGAAAMTTGVLPAILELAKDPKWRVRMAVIEQSALLAQHLGVKTFEKKIQSVVIGSLSDHVFSIRERACEQIGLIVKEFGGKWAAEKLFPTAFAIYDKTTNYLHRMTCLLVIQHCAAHSGAEVCEKSLLPLACTACIDDVPNVRIAAAKTMNELIPRLDRKLVDSKIKPLLVKMHTDTDPDVVYFSTVAAKRCQ